MELTITQNGALYFAHHKAKVSKPRAGLFWPLRTKAGKQDCLDLRGLHDLGAQGSSARR